MNTMLITGFGLVVLAVIAWQSLRERERDSRQIPPEWVVSIGRIANEQALGHHRDDTLHTLLRSSTSLSEL